MSKEIGFIIIGILILFGLAFEPLKENAARNRGREGDNPASKASSIASSKSTNDTKDTAETIRNTQEEIEQIEKELQKQMEESRRSPYYNKIKMSNLSGRNNPDPSKEYLRLSTNLDKGETVNITGWYLKSEVTGYFATIGKAALLPFPYTKNESDIILKDGDKVVLSKGFSPIGVSFHTNICTGYFEENRTFYPSLSKQ